MQLLAVTFPSLRTLTVASPIVKKEPLADIIILLMLMLSPLEAGYPMGNWARLCFLSTGTEYIHRWRVYLKVLIMLTFDGNTPVLPWGLRRAGMHGQDLF